MHVFYEGEVLWAQIDANQHMRHSAYADVVAQARLNMMRSVGLDAKMLIGSGIGPVIFREELVYLREIGLNEVIKATGEVTRSRPDGSRWTIRHEIYRSDGVKAAIITVDGAWIDLNKRKLTLLPDDIKDLFKASPRSEDYVEEIPKPKE
jgi:acyl-CoA thioester hydrolase